MSIHDLITQLRETRASVVEEAEKIVNAATKSKRDLTQDESTRFDGLKESLASTDARIKELAEFEENSRLAAEATKRFEGRGGGVSVGYEPTTYRRDGEHSFVKDLVRFRLEGDMRAAERLQRHGREVEVNLADRPEFRDISRTDGAGGEFVPPLWILEEYAAVARASRVFADHLGARPLPPGTDSINIPRITTGVTVDPQTGDNVAVSETDLVTTSVVAPVRTIAGQQDVAIQLLDQSPIDMTEVIFADLMAAYSAKLDEQLFNGSAAAGQLQGALGLAGINPITYTDTTPTVVELWPKLADAVGQIGTNRKLAATGLFLHPRRWAWITAALDTQNRPLLVPTGAGSMNAMGISQEPTTEGAVGTIMGLPAFVASGLPTNLGAGTNEDRIVSVHGPSLLLWESVFRTRVLPDVLSGTLTVRLQAFRYVSFAPGRYPGAISVVLGTGLTPPVL